MSTTSKRKGKPETQRVQDLMNDFVKIRREYPEKPIKEIADEYDVDLSYMYRLIKKIAKKEGISREELLFVPHKKHRSRSSKKNTVSVNVEEMKMMKVRIAEAIKQTESMIAKIKNMELGIQEEEL